MQGTIVKGVGGSYSVFTGSDTIECKPKGVFRKDGLKPLVGDRVSVECLPDGTGLISEILDRSSILIRPEVANVTQAMLVFAITSPNPSLNMVDRFLVNMEVAHVPTVIVFNKADLVGKEEIKKIEEAFAGSGYKTLFISAKQQENIEKVRKLLNDNITVLAGPSGVGKSTLINLLQENKKMETGGLSEKIMRGKNTTRHTEMLRVNDKSWIIDSPGFTSFDVCGIEANDLSGYYPEFVKWNGKCYYTGCAHINEPDCAVKEQVKKGKISKSRYENYVLIYNDIKNRKKY